MKDKNFKNNIATSVQTGPEGVTQNKAYYAINIMTVQRPLRTSVSGIE